MSPEEKRDFQRRARRAISAPVPKSILSGSTRSAADYKNCVQVVGAFLRNGRQAGRVRLYVLRIEGMQGLLP